MSLPQEFTDRMQNMLKEEYPAFLDSFSQPSHQALRINTLKGSKEQFLALFSKAFGSTANEIVPWESTGYYYPETIRPGKHPYHEGGVYYIQEPSAMAPAHYLDAKPGDMVLDLCAAPGGKSTQIACQLEGQGLIISNEIHPARAKILAENIERMGIPNAIVTNESSDSLSRHFSACFDRIMVDAPCSGEGMFRKNEEAISQWSTENVAICADRQDMILEEAHKMLKDGGRMVYSTCTFAPDENEGSIYRFLKHHPEYQVVCVSLAEGMSSGDLDLYEPAATTAEKDAISHTIRLWPHRLKGEGHFTAVLQKGSADNEKADSDAYVHPIFTYPASPYRLAENKLIMEQGKAAAKKDRSKSSARGKAGKSASSGSDPKAALSGLEEFLTQNLVVKLSGQIVFFGEQMYLLPEHAPSLVGLKVLRAGLHLGSFSKDRFEPSHALALYLKPENVKNSCQLNAIAQKDGMDAMMLASRFINGETFSYEGQKGWYLIDIDGYSIGWGRLAGNIMKNYYPKGLRKNLM